MCYQKIFLALHLILMKLGEVVVHLALPDRFWVPRSEINFDYENHSIFPQRLQKIFGARQITKLAIWRAPNITKNRQKKVWLKMLKIA